MSGEDSTGPTFQYERSPVAWSGGTTAWSSAAVSTWIVPASALIVSMFHFSGSTPVLAMASGSCASALRPNAAAPARPAAPARNERRFSALRSSFLWDDIVSGSSRQANLHCIPGTIRQRNRPFLSGKVGHPSSRLRPDHQRDVGTRCPAGRCATYIIGARLASHWARFAFLHA